MKYVSEALRSGWITAGLRHRFLPIGNLALRLILFQMPMHIMRMRSRFLLPTLLSEENADYVIESYSDIVKGYLADGLNRLE